MLAKAVIKNHWTGEQFEDRDECLRWNPPTPPGLGRLCPIGAGQNITKLTPFGGFAAESADAAHGHRRRAASLARARPSRNIPPMGDPGVQLDAEGTVQELVSFPRKPVELSNMAMQGTRETAAACFTGVVSARP